MKKILILFFSGILILALTIRSCNNSEKYEIDDDTNIVEFVSNIDTLANREEIANMGNETDENGFLIVNEILSDSDLLGLEVPMIMGQRPEQLLKRAGYVTSYNNGTKNANWVAWHLTREHTDGPWKRRGIPYYVDAYVKGARQELEDWSEIDPMYDHGHICPAGDNKWSLAAIHQTFLLTNMCPQNSSLNKGDWRILEEKCRKWANNYGEVYITAGPIFYSDKYKTIGDNNVGIPDAFFKVVLRMGKKPQALGFIYPNNGEGHDISDYVKTVNGSVEKS